MSKITLACFIETSWKSKYSNYPHPFLMLVLIIISAVQLSGLLINNWFWRTQRVVPHSANKAGKQGKLKVKVLHSFMGQSQGFWGQFKRRASCIEGESGVLVGKFHLCLIDLGALSSLRLNSAAFPWARCSATLPFCRGKLFISNGFFQNWTEFLSVYLCSSHDLLLQQEWS